MNSFENQTLKEISIDEAADKLKVSTATISNWIKVGNIIKTRRGYLDYQIFNSFVKSNRGQAKLVNRANKSGKDSHNHAHLSEQVLSKLNDRNENSEEFGSFYEKYLSDSYRNKEGIYYTPKAVIDMEFANISSVNSHSSFCDPSCGSGNYVMAAIEKGFDPKLVFGFDIDPIAVEITKERIYRKTGFRTENIKCLDFLKDSLSAISQQFDFIFTNPPWGKKLDKSEKEVYKKKYNAGSSVDTCSLFLFAAVKRLKPNGVLSFLLPESFFNVASFENARVNLLKMKITHLSNYGRAFEGLLTRAQSFTALKISESQIDASSKISVFSEGISYYRNQSSFSKNPKTIINLYANHEDAKIIDKMYEKKHITLEKSAKWGLGIITGNNKKFIQNSPFENSVPIYKGADIKQKFLAEPTNYIPDNFSLYQQVAPLEIYKSSPKIVYKFISKKICFFVDEEKRLFLNSANMFVLEKDFQINEQQLSDLFNSDVINWLYAKIFNSHKILRKDLEKIPVHAEFFKSRETFDEADYLDYLGIIKQPNGTYRIKK